MGSHIDGKYIWINTLDYDTENHKFCELGYAALEPSHI